MRNFKLGDYVIISNPKKDNVSFELTQLAIEHAGKFLVIGDDGNITTRAIPVYDGSVS